MITENNSWNDPELQPEHNRAEVAELSARYQECIAINKKLAFDLGERMKELHLQNSLSDVLKDTTYSIDEMLQLVAGLIPPAFRFPEQTGASITFHEKVFKTPAFSHDAPKLTQRLITDGLEVGLIEVSCTHTTDGEQNQPFLKEEGDLIRSIALRVGNYTTRAEKEIARRKGEILYHSILTASPDVITITDLEGKIVFSSDRAMQMFGSDTAETFDGHHLLEYIDPSDHARAMAEIGKMLSGNISGAAEYTALRTDGTKFDVEVNGEFIRNELGQPVQMIFVTRDITARKQTELELRKSEEKYKALFHDSPNGFLIIRDGIFTDCNRASEMLIGGTRSDIVGKTPDSISPEFQPNGKRSADYAVEMLNEAFQNGSNSFEWMHKKMDGTEFLAQINLAHIMYEGAPALFVSWKDITAMMEAENRLKKSEEKYRTIFETIRDVYYEVSPDGMILEVSPSVKIFSKGQYKREDLIGKSLIDLYANPDDRTKFFNILSETGYVSDYELDLLNRDGTIIPVAFSSGFVYDEKGTPLKIAGSMRDVSERKSALDELRKFSTISAKANYGIAIAALDGLLIYSNECFASMHGYSVDEITGKNLSILHSEQQIIRVMETIDMLKKNGEFQAEEVWRTRKDGTAFPSLMNAIVVFDKGIPQYMSATAIDITEIKEKEKEIHDLNATLEQKIMERTAELAETNKNLIREIEERQLVEEALNTKTTELEQFFSVALDLLCIADTSGNFLKVNKAWEIILGYKAADLEHRQFLEFVHPDDLQATLDAMARLDEQHPVLDFTNRYRSSDGSYRFIEWHSVPVGHLIYAAARDVTERIMNEEELRKARREADQANLAKSEFLSHMSHELRTPMNSILGFAQLLDRGVLTQGQRKGVSHILHSGKHLLELINEVLDISRIESGRISLSPEPVQLSGVFNEMIDIVQPLASERKVTLQVIRTPELNCFIRSDRQRLKQILLNLINNAVKYNREGGEVLIKAQPTTPHTDGSRMIRISITDTGYGISEKDLPKLFTPFERIGAEKTQTEGTGLGLAVVKKLTEVMGGNIGVESIQDEGSNFWIEFREVENQQEQLERNGLLLRSEQSANQWGGTVLYVEDNKPNIDLVEEILNTTRPGIKLITTIYGRQATGLANEFKPDLILLDLNLPDIHGSEVLRILKADPRVASIPVVIITADIMRNQIEKLKQTGAADYLAKPLDIDDFLKMIDQYFSLKSS